MVLKDLVQGSEEWLTWRASGVTATDIPVLLGLSPYKTSYRLWLEKTGRANPPDLSNNPHVRRGHALEDIARQEAENHLGEYLIPACGECAENPVLRASFDGLTREDMPVELKAPSERVMNDVLEKGRNSDTFKLYESQVKAQLVVAGQQHGLLMFFREDAAPLYFNIELEPDDANCILELAAWFWDFIEKDKAPPIDPERDLFIPESGEGEFRWRGLADDWLKRQALIDSAKSQIKALELEQKQIQDSLVESMGEHLAADYAGVKVTRFNKRGGVDYAKAIKALEIDEVLLEEFRRPARMETRFTVSKDVQLNAKVIGNEMEPSENTFF